MIFFSQNEIPNILTYQKTNIRFFKFCGSQFLASMDCPSKENPYIEELKLILFDLLLNTRKFKLHIFATICTQIRNASFNFKYFAIKALNNFNFQR